MPDHKNAPSSAQRAQAVLREQLDQFRDGCLVVQSPPAGSVYSKADLRELANFIRANDVTHLRLRLGMYWQNREAFMDLAAAVREKQLQSIEFTLTDLDWQRYGLWSALMTLPKLPLIFIGLIDPDKMARRRTGELVQLAVDAFCAMVQGQAALEEFHFSPYCNEEDLTADHRKQLRTALASCAKLPAHNLISDRGFKFVYEATTDLSPAAGFDAGAQSHEPLISLRQSAHSHLAGTSSDTSPREEERLDDDSLVRPFPQ